MDKIEITEDMVQDAIRCVENSMKVESVRCIALDGYDWPLRALRTCEPLKSCDGLTEMLQNDFDESVPAAKLADIHLEDVPHVLAYTIEELASDGWLDPDADDVYPGGFEDLVKQALDERSFTSDGLDRFRQEGKYDFTKDDSISGVTVHTVGHGVFRFGDVPEVERKHRHEGISEQGERLGALSGELGKKERGGLEVRDEMKHGL